MNINTSLEDVARHINWYTHPDRLLSEPNLFLCQVMARGSTDDVLAVQRHYSIEAFRRAYLDAPPGLFTRRAWAYWGLMLLNNPRCPLPERFPGANRLDWRTAT